MGSVVAVAALKGGVGKSTLATNIACALLGRGLRVALVDADEQATAVAWSQPAPDESRPGLPVPVIALPATERLNERRWLDSVLEASTGVDVLLLDMPPQLGAAMRAALVATDLLLVPVTPSGIDLASTSRVLELVREARAVRGRGRPLDVLLVPSRVDRRTAAGREIEAALHDLGEPVGPAIAQRAAHADAFTAGAWIGAFAPRSLAHQEIETLAALVRRRLGRAARAKA